jgi:hypothetical protein
MNILSNNPATAGLFVFTQVNQRFEKGYYL